MYRYNCHIGWEAMYKVGVESEYVALRNMSFIVGLLVVSFPDPQQDTQYESKRVW